MAGKRKTTEKTTRKTTRRKAPVLVLGWGNDGCGDIDHIASTFNNDDSIDWAKGRFADSKEVGREIAEWLESHDNPQTLYLGCHGLGNGLGAYVSSLSKLGYRELSEIITNHLKPGAHPLTVILGACESSTAADVWNALNQGSVGLLVAFPESPESPTVRKVLELLLKRGNILATSQTGEELELPDLPDDITMFRDRFLKSVSSTKGSKLNLPMWKPFPTKERAPSRISWKVSTGWMRLVG